jgi:hypothetical protein
MWSPVMIFDGKLLDTKGNPCAKFGIFLIHLDRICCGFFGKKFVVLCIYTGGSGIASHAEFFWVEISYRRVQYWTPRKSGFLSILWVFLYFFPLLLLGFFHCVSRILLSTSSHRLAYVYSSKCFLVSVSASGSKLGQWSKSEQNWIRLLFTSPSGRRFARSFS